MLGKFAMEVYWVNSFHCISVQPDVNTFTIAMAKSSNN